MFLNCSLSGKRHNQGRILHRICKDSRCLSQVGHSSRSGLASIINPRSCNRHILVIWLSKKITTSFHSFVRTQNLSVLQEIEWGSYSCTSAWVASLSVPRVQLVAASFDRVHWKATRSIYSIGLDLYETSLIVWKISLFIFPLVNKGNHCIRVIGFTYSIVSWSYPPAFLCSQRIQLHGE